MMAVLPGYTVWEYTTPVTLVASPLVGPWLPTDGFSTILPLYAVAGGTSTITIEGSFDGTNADADIAYGAQTPPGSAFSVISPYIRVRLVQTVADATKTKIYFKARA